MASKAIKALKRAQKEGLLLVCKVDENYSYRVCCLYHQHSNECKKVVDNFSGDGISLWGVLQCKLCLHIWDRDINACRNISYLWNLKHTGQPGPEVFSCSMLYTPPPSSGSSDDFMDIEPDVTTSRSYLLI
jgi:transposase